MLLLVGYARISTQDQSVDLQWDALKKAGCHKIFSEVASGAKTERPQLEEALQYCRAGDTLVVWKLDRLGRSLPHLIDTIRQLQAKNIGFKSLQESIDTTTTGGKLIFHMFSALAEFKRDVIRERTRASLTAARARGRKGGRPKVMDSQKIQMAKTLYEAKTHTIGQICRMLKISQGT